MASIPEIQGKLEVVKGHLEEAITAFSEAQEKLSVARSAVKAAGNALAGTVEDAPSASLGAAQGLTIQSISQTGVSLEAVTDAYNDAAEAHRRVDNYITSMNQ